MPTLHLSRQRSVDAVQCSAVPTYTLSFEMYKCGGRVNYTHGLLPASSLRVGHGLATLLDSMRELIFALRCKVSLCEFAYRLFHSVATS